MTIADFKDIAAGIQSLAIAGAAIVAGIWALFRFLALRELQKAKAELNQKLESLKKSGLLNLSLSCSVACLQPERGAVIIANAVVHNPGSRAEIIDWDESEVVVTQVEDAEHGGLRFGTRISEVIMQPVPLRRSTIWPDETTGYHFAAQVPQHGLYHVRFRCVVSGTTETDSQTIYEDHSLQVQGPLVWSICQYVEVPPTVNKENT